MGPYEPHGLVMVPEGPGSGGEASPLADLLGEFDLEVDDRPCPRRGNADALSTRTSRSCAFCRGSWDAGCLTAVGLGLSPAPAIISIHPVLRLFRRPLASRFPECFGTRGCPGSLVAMESTVLRFPDCF